MRSFRQDVWDNYIRNAKYEIRSKFKIQMTE